MRLFCAGCGTTHDDFNWISTGGKDYCRKFFKVQPIEVVPERIKRDRITYAREILQPLRAGELSREWCEVYPKKAIKNYGRERVAKARNVWK